MEFYANGEVPSCSVGGGRPRASVGASVELTSSPTGEAGLPAAPVADLEAGVLEGDDCSICLESLCSCQARHPSRSLPNSHTHLARPPLAQAVNLAGCKHSLHLACLASLVKSGATLCPVCRAGLVPAQLAHLQSALTPVRGARGGNVLEADLRRLAAGLLPGVEARPGATLTLDDWVWARHLDMDEMEELGPEAMTALANHRRAMERGLSVRRVCSRVSLGITFAFFVLVLYFLASSFLHHKRTSN